MTYWDLDDLKQDLSRVVSPWTVLTSAHTEVKIGIVRCMHLTHLVTVYANLNVTVSINEVTLSSSTFSVQKQTIFSFLREILAMLPCEGVSVGELQHLAPLPSGDSNYYRHVVCHQSNAKMVHSSTVRASMCAGVVEEGAGLCTACEKVKGLLQKKLAGEQRGGPLHPKTPLHTVAKARLVCALRRSRADVRRVAAEKAAIMKRLRDA